MRGGLCSPTLRLSRWHHVSTLIPGRERTVPHVRIPVLRQGQIMTTFTLNRRALLTGTVALGTVGLLAACGGNSSKT